MIEQNDYDHVTKQCNSTSRTHRHGKKFIFLKFVN